jgi:hypothetical protein
VPLHRLHYALPVWDAAVERRGAQGEFHSAAQARAWAGGDFDADRGLGLGGVGRSPARRVRAGRAVPSGWRRRLCARPLAARYLCVRRYSASRLPEVRGRACAQAAGASYASCRSGSIYIWAFGNNSSGSSSSRSSARGSNTGNRGCARALLLLEFSNWWSSSKHCKA